MAGISVSQGKTGARRDLVILEWKHTVQGDECG